MTSKPLHPFSYLTFTLDASRQRSTPSCIYICFLTEAIRSKCSEQIEKGCYRLDLIASSQIKMIAEILRCFTSAYISPLWLQTSKSVMACITDFSFCRISGVDASGRAQQTVLGLRLRNSLCKHLGNHFLMLQALVVAPNKQKTSLSKPCGRA